MLFSLTRNQRLSTFAIVCFALLWSATASASPLVFESLTGPPTSREIAGFKAWMSEFRPDPNNENNGCAFGHSGQALEALGLLYEVQAVLPRSHLRAFANDVV